ncbi:MAG TPA: alpha/beta fold hydrolase [Nocardia sp.]|uniref:alpha/beta fold hydrolase n=1 Tax=Nocardia sp. TaxID=1821 RepID=UPI002B4B35FC|nr:alpha/beta fold hydrolase [Nocardia sp.]HLS78350.1 alpha/beta fold hydrolase [Nocardia sp.]
MHSTSAHLTTVGGVRIAYRDSGSRSGSTRSDRTRSDSTRTDETAAPVLLVHGMGGDGHTWNRFARELLAAGRRVIIPDLRGHGRSARAASYGFDEFGADLVALCDHLALDRVDLVGHSLGGYAVSCVAQQRPELVGRLVLEECPLPLRSGDEQLTPIRRLPTPAELWHATTSLVRHPRALWAFDRSMTASALEQFHKPHPLWWERLSGITAPTLVLRGGPGGMVDQGRLAMLVAALPDCTVTDFTCGHSIHRDRHREFAAAVLPFLGVPFPDVSARAGRR